MKLLVENYGISESFMKDLMVIKILSNGRMEQPLFSVVYGIKKNKSKNL